MINYLDLSKELGKPVGIHLPVMMWSIECQDMKVEKSKIVGVEAKVEKVWILQLAPCYGIAVSVKFESEQEARKFLTDKILNA